MDESLSGLKPKLYCNLCQGQSISSVWKHVLTVKHQQLKAALGLDVARKEQEWESLEVSLQDRYTQSGSYILTRNAEVYNRNDEGTHGPLTRCRTGYVAIIVSAVHRSGE